MKITLSVPETMWNELEAVQAGEPLRSTELLCICALMGLEAAKDRARFIEGVKNFRAHQIQSDRRRKEDHHG